MRSRRSVFPSPAGSAALALSLCLGAVSSTAYGQGDVLRDIRYAERVEPTTLSPIHVTSTTEDRAVSLFANRLVGTDAFGSTVPVLLSSLVPEEGPEAVRGPTATFRLREGVMWQEYSPPGGGLQPARPLTAEDIVFTVQLMRADRSQATLRNVAAGLKSVRAVSDDLVEFTLDEPGPSANVLNFLFFPVIPKHVFARPPAFLPKEQDFGRRYVVGTGPYAFQDWNKQDQVITFALHEGYFGSHPTEDCLPIRTIQLRVFPDEEIAVSTMINDRLQILPSVKPALRTRLQSDPNISIGKYGVRGYGAFFYNTRRAPLDDVLVRKALTYATNREEIFTTYYGHPPEAGNIPTGMPFGVGDGTIEPYPYDPEMAKQLLARAGYSERNADGYLLRNGSPFTLTVDNWEADGVTSRIIKQFVSDLRAVGIFVRENHTGYADFNERVTYYRDFEIAFSIYSFPVLGNPVRPFFTVSGDYKGGPNLTGWSNQRIEALMGRADTAKDPAEFLQHLRIAHREIHEGVPATFLFHDERYYAIRSDRLRNVLPDPSDFFSHADTWCCESR